MGQQDDIYLWGDPGEIFGADGTLEALLADLKDVGLDPNLTKFKDLGTIPGACANKTRVAQDAAQPEEADKANAVVAAAKEAAEAALRGRRRGGNRRHRHGRCGARARHAAAAETPAARYAAAPSTAERIRAARESRAESSGREAPVAATPSG